MLKFKKIISLIVPATLVVLPVALASCNDDSQIGQSIAADDVEVVVDTSFVITGHALTDNKVLSRTTTQLFGVISAKNFGTFSSDVVTQFMPAAQIDTTGIKAEYVDSLKLLMYMYASQMTGDSIAPMGVKVYPLTKSLETPISSNFNPEGYYDPNTLLGETIYNTMAQNTPDSISIYGHRLVEVNLPRALAQHLYTSYINDPSSYSTPTAFANKVFKGLYIKNSYGSGRITRISRAVMSMYYRRKVTLTNPDRDTLVAGVGTYYAVTPEIITNNNIRLTIAPEIQKRIDAGEPIVITPAGTEVEITFPALDIIRKYEEGVTNLGVLTELTMRIIADDIENDYGIAPPPHMLMVLKNKKDEFFSKNQLNDNKTSFYAAYNSSYKGYNFSGLRAYIMNLIDKKKKGEEITADDYTFVLTPVSISTEDKTDYYYGSSTSVVTAITPFVSFPAMASINLAKSRITLTYSRQTLRH